MVAAELTFASALRKAGGETEKHPIGETPILGGALAVCSFFFPPSPRRGRRRKDANESHGLNFIGR